MVTRGRKERGINWEPGIDIYTETRKTEEFFYRAAMEKQTGSKQEKEYIKAVYCHPAYLTSMHSTS